MKWLFIALPTIFIMFLIGSNEMSSINNLDKEQRESFEACISLRRKAPYFNLNCERLLDRVPIVETSINKNKIGNNDIKTLSIYDSETRKVDKNEEIKLRKLVERLFNTNKLRKN